MLAQPQPDTGECGLGQDDHEEGHLELAPGRQGCLRGTGVAGVTRVRLAHIIRPNPHATIVSVAKRDPVSIAFDSQAARLLERAYAQRGEWVSVRLVDPSVRQRTRFVRLGINVDGPDPVPAGGLNARTRWARGMVRSLHYQHKHGRRSGALEIEVGRHIPASPQFNPARPQDGGLPPSRQFRVRIRRGGQVALRAVQRLPDSRRIYDDEGQPAGRHADWSWRDYG